MKTLEAVLVSFFSCLAIVIFTMNRDTDPEYEYGRILYGEHLCSTFEGLQSYDAFTMTCKNGIKIGYEFKNIN